MLMAYILLFPSSLKEDTQHRCYWNLGTRIIHLSITPLSWHICKPSIQKKQNKTQFNDGETQTCTPSRANQRTYGFVDVNPVSSRHSGLKSATPLLHEPFKGGMSTRCSLIGLMREQLVFLSHNVQVTVTPGNSREQNSFKGTRRATGQE